jgi:hypothetical protein
MPAKPAWFNRLDEVVELLTSLPDRWIDRSTIEAVLGVGRRRAQQILRPLVTHTIGKNGLADRDDLIRHLRALAAGEVAFYEKARRARFASTIESLRRQAIHQPRVLVEAPSRIVNQRLENLPVGVRLMPGRIVLEDFRTPEEAKQKLLALIMAIGNDPEGFDSSISVTQ